MGLMDIMKNWFGYGQMVNMLTGKLYEKFIDEDVKDFDKFHMAMLDVFCTLNQALPGKHYDVPPRKEVEKFFTDWEKATATPDEQKKKFIDFMTEHVKLSKPDGTMITTGVMAPPAAMAAKRAGQNVPQLKMLKLVPDVAFVPSVTVLALISVKIVRRLYPPNEAS